MTGAEKREMLVKYGVRAFCDAIEILHVCLPEEWPEDAGDPPDCRIPAARTSLQLASCNRLAAREALEVVPTGGSYEQAGEIHIRMRSAYCHDGATDYSVVEEAPPPEAGPGGPVYFKVEHTEWGFEGVM